MWTAEYVEEVMMAVYEPRLTIFIWLTQNCLVLLCYFLIFTCSFFQSMFFVMPGWHMTVQTANHAHSLGQAPFRI